MIPMDGSNKNTGIKRTGIKAEKKGKKGKERVEWRAGGEINKERERQAATQRREPSSTVLYNHFDRYRYRSNISVHPIKVSIISTIQ